MTLRHDRLRKSTSFRTSPPAFVLALLALLLLILTPAAAAQDAAEEVPVVTTTTAIRNARIVQAPGQAIERGTVVMRDGLITAVGSQVEIPYDAEIIDGDSLVVYAGFVDGLSHAGVPEDDDEPARGRDVNPADPPDELAGIQPDRSARSVLDPEDESVDDLRNIGFTVAHVVPRGRMLPGAGSIIVLRGDEAREMVLRPDVSLLMQFEGGRGVYPGTSIGVMAKLRQLVREADRRRRIERLYDEDPAGLERPAFDPVHEAFYPIISREKPLFVRADGDDSALKVHRALQLQEELGFALAIAGLDQGFDVVDVLAGTDTPLFLTLDLPDEPDEPDTTDAAVDTTVVDTTAAETPPADTTRAITPEDPASFFVSDLRTHSYEDVEAERRNLEARRSIERGRYVATAADFHEADLRFGVTTLGADPDEIRGSLREMIEAGLPEDAALAALTIDGARLLGIDRSTGTVEEGKMANLVVSQGSYFDPDNPVRYVFVDGQMFEIEEDPDDDDDDDASEVPDDPDSRAD